MRRSYLHGRSPEGPVLMCHARVKGLRRYATYDMFVLFFISLQSRMVQGVGRLEQVVAVEKKVSSTPYVLPVIHSCVPRNLTIFKKGSRVLFALE